MSQSDSPIRTMFDAQRTATKQTEQAIKQGMQTQASTGRLLLSGLRMQETMQRQGLEMAQAATAGTMDTMTAMFGMTGAADQRRTVDQLFDQLKAAHRQLYDTIDRELQRSIESFDDLSEEYYAAMDDQMEQLMGTVETLEDQSVEGFDEFNRQLREQFERAQAFQDEFEARFEEGSEQAEALLERQAEQVQEFQEELEREGRRLRQQMTQQAGRTQQMVQGRAAGGATAAVEGDLEEINGIGAAMKEDLQSAGIMTLDDLARADPARVAEVTGRSEDRVTEWIDQAGELVGTPA